MSTPPRWFDSFGDPVVIIGTAVSVILGVLFYVRSDVGTALGVFAGLLGITITLQVQALAVGQQRADAASKTVRTVEKIESISWLPEYVEQLVMLIGHVEENLPETATRLSRQTVDECVSRLTDLQRGHFRPTYGDQRLFLTLTAEVANTMLATSAQEVDLGWWTSPRSDKYWQLQIEALKRGVKITRVFIYHDWNKPLADLAKMQADAGVTVYRVKRENIPPGLVADMVIWDRICGYETESNAAGQAIQNFFTFAAYDIDKLSRDFEIVRAVASPL
jgi:hypothetical protein